MLFKHNNDQKINHTTVGDYFGFQVLLSLSRGQIIFGKAVVLNMSIFSVNAVTFILKSDIMAAK